MENKIIHKYIALLYDRVVGPKKAKPHTLEYWREIIFASVAVTALVLGFFALFFGVLASFRDGLYSIITFDIILYIFGLVILPNKRVPIIIKKYVISYGFYLVGLILLILLGRIGAGYSWLFAFPLIAGILIGFKTGIYTLITNMLTFLLIGIFLVHLKLFPNLPVSEYDTLQWIAVTVNFMFLNITITIANGIILRGLRVSVQEQNKLSKNLQHKNKLILKANLKLRHEINNKIQVESELREAIRKAEAASVAKTEFLSNMSHEIRTPLNAIIGFAEILAKKSNSDENPAYMKGISDSGHDLLSLVDKILDLSKIESKKMVIKNNIVDIGKVFYDLKIMFEQAIEDKGLRSNFKLNNHDIDFIIIDDFRLKQVLVNLIENGIKFTDKGEIRVVFDINETSHDNKTDLIISVEDTGIGIDEKDYVHLFENFWQKDGKANRKYDGTGLGLALVKNLIELMHGEIKVESEKGIGSKFTVVFKAVSVPAENELKEKNITKHKSVFSIPNLAGNPVNIEEPDPGLIKIVSNDFIPKIKKLEANMFLNDITEFGEELLKISQDHQDKRLIYLSQKLIKHSSVYELDRVKVTLQQIADYSTQ